MRPFNAYGQVYLILVVRFGFDAADAALEDVCPSHFEELGDGFVFAGGDIADEELFSFGCLAFCSRVRAVVHYGDGVVVVAVIEVPFESEERADFEFVEYFVAVVILATGKVSFFEEKFLSFHSAELF